jgi:uncharacterized protein YbjT (DUF2867 family)/uncharacterized membrane protein YphA (DoxX/SURF4 family)
MAERPRRVFLTGATGFMGGHLLRALSERGHTVTCLARGDGIARIEAMALPGVRVVAGEFAQPAEWISHLAGQEVVVNTVGIIRERPGATFAAVHAEAPIALFEAAARAGVRKILQVSAVGAEEGAQSRYHRTKGAADAALARLGVPYLVLRPSFIYGTGDRWRARFLALAAQPVTPVPGDGQFRVQPVAVEELVRALVMAVERPECSEGTVDVGGREALTFDALIDMLARWLGKRHGARKLHVPWSVMGLIAAFTDAAGGRGPITGEELGMLRLGSVADNRAFVECFGFEPITLEAGLARRQRTEADVWRARLTHLRVPLRLSVAFIWLATGIISAFVYPESESRALMARVGLEGPPATVALYGASFGELLLGLATALGYRVRLMGTIELALIFVFTALLTFGIPELWMHPFGPLTKNIPLIGATLAMMALEE